MSVSNYGGGEVNVISQLSVVLTHREKECRAVVLVQKGAPLGLLLGTDVLNQLGFYLLESSGEQGSMMELLEGRVWQNHTTADTSPLRADAPAFVPGTTMVTQGMESQSLLIDTEAAQEAKQTTAPEQPSFMSADNRNGLEATAKEDDLEVGVKLRKTVRIPARHAKVVPVKVTDMEVIKSKASVNMLKPGNWNLLEQGVVITNSLVQPDRDGCFKIFVENRGFSSVYLDQEQVIGDLEPSFEDSSRHERLVPRGK